LEGDEATRNEKQIASARDAFAQVEKMVSVQKAWHYLLRGCANTAPVRLRLRISTPLPVSAAMFSVRAKQTALRPEGGRADAVELA